MSAELGLKVLDFERNTKVHQLAVTTEADDAGLQVAEVIAGAEVASVEVPAPVDEALPEAEAISVSHAEHSTAEEKEEGGWENEELAGRSDTVPVCIYTMGGDSLEVQILPVDSVSRIKWAISRQNGIDPCRQKLMLNDMEVDKTQSLLEGTELEIATRFLDLVVVEPPIIHRF
jgi:hypothetical protein